MDRIYKIIFYNSCEEYDFLVNDILDVKEKNKSITISFDIDNIEDIPEDFYKSFWKSREGNFGLRIGCSRANEFVVTVPTYSYGILFSEVLTDKESAKLLYKVEGINSIQGSSFYTLNQNTFNLFFKNLREEGRF